MQLCSIKGTAVQYVLREYPGRLPPDQDKPGFPGKPCLGTERGSILARGTWATGAFRSELCTDLPLSVRRELPAGVGRCEYILKAGMFCMEVSWEVGAYAVMFINMAPEVLL